MEIQIKTGWLSAVDCQYICVPLHLESRLQMSISYWQMQLEGSISFPKMKMRSLSNESFCQTDGEGGIHRTWKWPLTVYTQVPRAHY